MSLVTDKFYLYSDKFFLLKIYLDGVSKDIVRKYIQDVSARQKLVESYINRYYINNSKLVASPDELDEHIHIDAGFDLYVPSSYDVDMLKNLLPANVDLAENNDGTYSILTGGGQSQIDTGVVIDFEDPNSFFNLMKYANINPMYWPKIQETTEEVQTGDFNDL